MLKLYKTLFQQLDYTNIDYCIYKSLNHLEDDLNGLRGDIDILASEQDKDSFLKIANQCGFCCKKVNDSHFYLLGIDLETHKMVMIDLSTVIYAGKKPFKPFSLTVCMKKLSINNHDIKILSEIDYIPLMFLIRVMSSSEKLKDLEELQDYFLRNNSKINKKGYVHSVIEDSIACWSDVEKSIIEAKSWRELKNKYMLKATALYRIDRIKFLSSRFILFNKALNKVKKIFDFPPYRVRKGRLIAFIGVDGSGKSSTINYLKKLPYFKLTGVKRIYFGSNEYWVPGLHFLLIRSADWSKYLKILVGTLALIDRQLRSVGAYYHLLIGNTVLADRYVFDEFIGRKMSLQNGGAEK